MKRQTEDNLLAAVALVYIVVGVAWIGFLVWAGVQLVQWITSL